MFIDNEVKNKKEIKQREIKMQGNHSLQIEKYFGYWRIFLTEIWNEFTFYEYLNHDTWIFT